MTTHQAAHPSARTAQVDRALLALRTFALLSTLNVLYQGVTAGETLMKNREAHELHEIGAVGTHVFSGLALIAALLYWRSARGSSWPSIIAALLFVGTFVQAAYGHGRTLYIHVPLALFILLGAAWLLTWSWLTRAPGNAAGSVAATGTTAGHSHRPDTTPHS